jgi:S-formylglutathione hydrolase FrmB
MMAEELVTHSEEFFLTLGAEFGKESRAISGHASGGYGAMRIAMQHPDLFNSVSAIDAPLALAGDGDFGGVRELFDDYLDESGINSETSYYAADTLGFRSQPFKVLLYSMAATYSPVLEPAGSSKLENLRIALPFDYTGALVESVWSQWMANDLYSWLDETSYQEALDGQHIYFETSDHDVNLFNQQTLLFEQKLTSLRISYESATFSGYEGYDAQSRSFLYDRLANILKFHNRYLKDRFGKF